MKSKARAMDDIDGLGDRVGDAEPLREERLQTPPYMQPLHSSMKLQVLSSSRINSIQSSSDGEKINGIA